jgi:serine protease AprX
MRPCVRMGAMWRSFLLATLALSVSTSWAQQPSKRVSPSLRALLEASPPGEAQLVWVYFRDKNGESPRSAASALTARALERRVRRGRVANASASRIAFEDRPVPTAYVRAVEDRVHRLRHVSRWLNAASVEADDVQTQALLELDFVSRLDVVRRYRRDGEDLSVPTGSDSVRERESDSLADIDYGTSFDQLAQIQVPALHSRGFHGEEMVVAVFDTGFNNLSHPAFKEMTILARRDFVNGDGDVTDGRDRGNGTHGTATLSVLGAFAPGELVGPAFRASFILAKTEDTESETPIEEDHWAAAAEWAEAMGADVISSSLGYLTFDPGYPSYDFWEMDGETAVTTRAAQRAAERGVLVVTSNGNGGFNSRHNTLGAPADGKLVLGVGAVDSFGARADFSSVGLTEDGRIKPDVMAKGVLVKLAAASGVGYRLGNGTSFSCPLVAGVAAVVLQIHPDWRVDQVIKVLRATASRAETPDRLMGWGIVDALTAIESVPSPVSDGTEN